MGKTKKGSQSLPPITAVTVCGYKSLVSPQTVEIRPLTILAGANSSGKSSIMQPLLLMKQTLAESSDPGAILLEGANVKCTSVDDLLSKRPDPNCKNGFWVSLEFGHYGKVTTHYVKANGGFRIREMRYQEPGEQEIAWREGMSHDDIAPHVPKEFQAIPTDISKKGKWRVARRRCFLELVVATGKTTYLFALNPAGPAAFHMQRIIHLPGLRGNPEPTYPVRSVGREFPGQFQDYVASVIDKWKSGRSRELNSLKKDLQSLHLTWKVDTKHVTDTRVEILVGRLPHGAVGSRHDLVSIAHVGFGVSQALPVVVALLAAFPGQIVYIEQPEIHLHPKAQIAMAELLVDAANRGVRVVAETHSALLLLAIQTALAKGKIAPSAVKLHWFQRDEQGCTKVTSADPDEKGRFGDWPEDFGKTELEAQDDYLSAAEKQHANGRHAK
jgi:hypothetical protein